MEKSGNTAVMSHPIMPIALHDLDECDLARDRLLTMCVPWWMATIARRHLLEFLALLGCEAGPVPSALPFSGSTEGRFGEWSSIGWPLREQ